MTSMSHQSKILGEQELTRLGLHDIKVNLKQISVSLSERDKL